MKITKGYTCCFVGHREIDEDKETERRLYSIIEELILKEKVDTFLFGSKSQFDDLCYSQVSKIREKYSNIKRIYIRAEFPEISEEYEKYLLEFYEETYYPKKLSGANKAVYIKRNYDMIDKSQICIFYIREKHFPKNRKSGTKIALEYAVKRDKKIILL